MDDKTTKNITKIITREIINIAVMKLFKFIMSKLKKSKQE